MSRRQLDDESMLRDLINIEVSAFAREHKHLDDLAELVAAYIRRGYSLDEAYWLANKARKFFGAAR